MSVYDKLYISPVSGDNSAKYYFNGNTTIDNMDGWHVPSRRVSAGDVLNRDGWIKHTAGYEGINLNIDYYMECNSYTDLWKEKDTLNEFLRCSELQIVRETLGRFMIGTYQSDSWVDKAEDEGIRIAGRLSFVCHDPFKYSTTATNDVLKGLTHSGKSNSYYVYNSGNYEVYPSIYVSGVIGSIANFSITNLKNNTMFSYVNPLNVGEFVLVDNDAKDCYISGGVSALKYTAPQTNFIRIDPGHNQIFVETRDLSSGQFSISFDTWFRNRWL
jgi:hypothetical protein